MNLIFVLINVSLIFIQQIRNGDAVNIIIDGEPFTLKTEFCMREHLAQLKPIPDTMLALHDACIKQNRGDEDIRDIIVQGYKNSVLEQTNCALTKDHTLAILCIQNEVTPMSSLFSDGTYVNEKLIKRSLVYKKIRQLYDCVTKKLANVIYDYEKGAEHFLSCKNLPLTRFYTLLEVKTE